MGAEADGVEIVVQAPVVNKVYLCTSDQPAETGGERPHKMKLQIVPFRTTTLAGTHDA